MEPMIAVNGLEKNFVLHLQGGVHLSVLRDIHLNAQAGECLVLNGPSGTGKSTLLRLLYANYKPDKGEILIRHNGGRVDLARADLRKILEMRKQTLGYVSQFLRVIPRVPALRVVMEPLLSAGMAIEEAGERARELLLKLHIPSRLWNISPTTFSGGEQQRINIARCFIARYPVLLLDEPTAALDAVNRRAVVELISEAKARGTAVVGVFHDEEVRCKVADRVFEIFGETGAA